MYSHHIPVKTVKIVFIKFNNFWHKDGQDNRVIWSALIFHLIHFVLMHYRIKRICTKLLHYAAIISIRLLTFASSIR